MNIVRLKYRKGSRREVKRRERSRCSSASGAVCFGAVLRLIRGFAKRDPIYLFVARYDILQIGILPVRFDPPASPGAYATTFTKNIFRLFRIFPAQAFPDRSQAKSAHRAELRLVRFIFSEILYSVGNHLSILRKSKIKLRIIHARHDIMRAKLYSVSAQPFGKEYGLSPCPRRTGSFFRRCGCGLLSSSESPTKCRFLRGERHGLRLQLYSRIHGKYFLETSRCQAQEA